MGARMAAARKKARLSRAQLAAALGWRGSDEVSYSTYYRIEAGTRAGEPSVGQIEAIAKVLGLSTARVAKAIRQARRARRS